MTFVRWSDDRLDDLHRRVEDQGRLLAQLTNVQVQQAEFAQQLSDQRDDVRSCLHQLQKLVDDQQAQQRALVAREREQHRERVVDRRWLIGTALTVAALVIAAIQVFLG